MPRDRARHRAPLRACALRARRRGCGPAGALLRREGFGQPLHPLARLADVDEAAARHDRGRRLGWRAGVRLVDLPQVRDRFRHEPAAARLCAFGAASVHGSGRKLRVAGLSPDRRVLGARLRRHDDLRGAERAGARLHSRRARPLVGEAHFRGGLLPFGQRHAGALGAAVPKINGFITLNVLGNANYDGIASYGSIEFNGNEVEITSENISKYSLMVSGIFIGLIILVCGILFATSAYFGSQAEAKQNEINMLQTQIAELEKKISTGIITLIKQISEKNKTGINFYDSLSSDIPPHVWLNYYYNLDGDSVAIEGYSLEINDIYEYYKSLKILAPKSKILLNELEVFSDEENEADIDSMAMNDLEQNQQVFKFVISNVEYTKTFDEKGNKITADNKNKKTKKARAAKIPVIPDVEVNLKEIK